MAKVKKVVTMWIDPVRAKEKRALNRSINHYQKGLLGIQKRRDKRGVLHYNSYDGNKKTWVEGELESKRRQRGRGWAGDLVKKGAKWLHGVVKKHKLGSKVAELAAAEAKRRLHQQGVHSNWVDTAINHAAKAPGQFGYGKHSIVYY